MERAGHVLSGVSPGHSRIRAKDHQGSCERLWGGDQWKHTGQLVSQKMAATWREFREPGKAVKM